MADTDVQQNMVLIALFLNVRLQNDWVAKKALRRVRRLIRVPSDSARCIQKWYRSHRLYHPSFQRYLRDSTEGEYPFYFVRRATKKQWIRIFMRMHTYNHTSVDDWLTWAIAKSDCLGCPYQTPPPGTIVTATPQRVMYDALCHFTVEDFECVGLWGLGGWTSGRIS